MPQTGPILVVDDDTDDREIMAEVFEALQLSNPVVFKADGKEAFEYLKEIHTRPFLILCDVNMPRVNGIELRNKIVEDPELHSLSIPFVFLTTTATPQALIEAYKLEVQGFFEKTNTMASMQANIELIVNYWRTCRLPMGLKKQF